MSSWHWFLKVKIKHSVSLIIFLFQGENDDLEKTLFKGNQHIKEMLVKKGYFADKILEYFEPSAQHNEDAWRYAFNYAIDAYMKHKCNK